MNRSCLNYFVSFLFIARFTQAQVPHLTGILRIELKKGYIAGDLTLSNLPPLHNNYLILLNRGLNIKAIKTDSSALFYEYYGVKTDGYAAQYVPLVKEDTLPLPSSLKISYVGAFPIYDQEYNAFDDVGIIALNSKTLRANSPAAWYPIIKDLRSGHTLSRVSYDLTIQCSDCAQIYLNGSAPHKGPMAHLQSKIGRDLFLFVGDFQTNQFDQVSYINTSLDARQAMVFSRQVNQVIHYYESKLGVKYADQPVFLRHTPIERFNPGRLWGFVVYPTFAFAGQDYKASLDFTKNDFVTPAAFGFYAHELAHFYFGSLFGASSTMANFLGESVPEYLSLKALEHKYNADSLKQAVRAKLVAVQAYVDKGGQFVGLSQVTDPDQVNSTYRYELGPLLLLYLEKEVGESTVLAALSQMLKEGSRVPTDYAYFKSKLRQAGARDTVLSQIESALFTQPMPVGLLRQKLLN